MSDLHYQLASLDGVRSIPEPSVIVTADFVNRCTDEQLAEALRTTVAVLAEHARPYALLDSIEPMPEPTDPEGGTP